MDSSTENRLASGAVVAGVVFLVLAGLGTSLVASIINFPYVHGAFLALGGGQAPGSTSSLDDIITGVSGGVISFADLTSLLVGIGAVFAIALGVRDLRS